MEALKLVVRLRWVIYLAALAITWMTYKPVAYVLTWIVCCVAPFDLLLALLPSARRRANRAKSAQVRAESRRMLDES